MAIDFTFPFQGLLTRIAAQMMTAQTIATDGEWADFAHLSTWSIDIENFSGSDLVQVRVSNRLNQPNNSYHGCLFGPNITKDSFVSNANHRFRWGKVMKPTGGGSPTDAFLFGDWRLAGR